MRIHRSIGWIIALFLALALILVAIFSFGFRDFVREFIVIPIAYMIWWIGMAVAAAIGIKPKLLYETITASQAGTVSNLFKELGSRVAASNYDNLTFTVDLLIKDIQLGVQMAKEGGAPPILGRTVELINEIAQAQGLGPSDTSAMWQSYLKVWGMKG